MTQQQAMEEIRTRFDEQLNALIVSSGGTATELTIEDHRLHDPDILDRLVRDLMDDGYFTRAGAEGLRVSWSESDPWVSCVL